MRRGVGTWTVFGACAACGVALLAWLTAALLQLERAEAAARAHAAHEVALGSALWQMDGWLLPILAEEAQRPVADYVAFPRVEEAYSNLLGKLSPGEVVTPSPLLSFRSEWFLLHFQVDAQGRVTSPQVPVGNELDVAQTQAEAQPVEDKRALLERVRPLVSPAKLFGLCSTGVANLPEAQIKDVQQLEGDGVSVNYNLRAQATTPARQKVKWLSQELAPQAPPAGPHAGSLVPMWVHDAALGDCLLFVRHVSVQGQRVFQGVLADWTKLSATLLAKIADTSLRGCARLVRVDQPDHSRLAHMLTVVPARLEATAPPVELPRWTPGRTLLVIAWGALVVTALTVALTLRAALQFGARRARFASAVTHELRTPLTTFRMYAEMLAKGMVPDKTRQQEYLTTLQAESDRLARLVENVLGYARIEDGRFRARIERVTLGDLLARVQPVLQRRAGEAGFVLQVEVEGHDVACDTDIDAVGQILFNLVDNACKYGRPPLVLHARADAGGARLALRDHGPGVPAALRARVFLPFDRGARQTGDNEVPGVGLGLALARELARDLGGDVTLEDAAPGARFTLSL
jgi:signal transduction histidine kinase